MTTPSTSLVQDISKELCHGGPRGTHFHGGASCAGSEQLNLRASFVAQTKTPEGHALEVVAVGDASHVVDSAADHRAFTDVVAELPEFGAIFAIDELSPGERPSPEERYAFSEHGIGDSAAA
ncbi:hypothetical protein KC353_g76 [Hortaea werneckii]|nr:hypothetical protein KC353_g76 [Hortaea werneckii]